MALRHICRKFSGNISEFMPFKTEFQCILWIVHDQTPTQALSIYKVLLNVYHCHLPSKTKRLSRIKRSNIFSHPIFVYID